MRAIGLDIGTTTLSAVVLDPESGDVLAARTFANESAIAGPEWAKMQDPRRIRELALSLVEALGREYAPVSAIGLTGQMHGIVYLDEKGEPASPLYTWQDERGDLPAEGGESYAERLSRLTGHPFSTGYGLATHYYNLRNGLVPERARKIACIADCVGMWLTGANAPVAHGSDAASMGAFDPIASAFDTAALERAGIDRAMLPDVVFGASPIGNTKDGAVVSVAVGDNQASFAGSVRSPSGSVLVNMGTGGQISVGAPSPVAVAGCETRPGVDGGWLLVGSSLCGGRAYALLEGFFRDAMRLAGAQEKTHYDWMNRAAESALNEKDPLFVDTAFGGTRQNPAKRGGIRNLSLHNFTPGNLCAGVLRGMVEELHAYYRAILPALDERPSLLVGSGNGVRMNPVLRALFEEAFGMPLRVPKHREEAAYGAALCASVASGLFPDMAAAQARIRYEDDKP